MSIYTKLQRVPAISIQELFIYVAEKTPATTVSIVAKSGHAYTGQVVNFGTTSDKEYLLCLQLVDEKNAMTERVLHITVQRIESVMLNEQTDAIGILSLGNVFASQVYEISGKLDVQRAFKTLSDSLSSAHGIAIDGPWMDLPSDGKALNRILKLAGFIRDMLIDVLKDEDARISWKERFTSIAFVDGPALSLTRNGLLLMVIFPFSDTQAPEVDPAGFKEQLLSVL